MLRTYPVEVEVMDGDGMEGASDNTGGEKAKLSFESFDGGGPVFNVLVSDEGIVSYETEVKYYSSDHGEMNGSGFDKIRHCKEITS